jgi:hypothetical protein
VNKLTFSEVIFYSQKDEDIFFNWFEGLSSTRGIIGDRSDIVVTTSARVDDQELREMLAIFRRYSLDMSQLSCYCTEDNASWFRDRNKNWYEDVFEAS